MELIKITIEDIKSKKLSNIIKNCIVCLGEFDGVHKGHIKLIDKCLKYSKKEEKKSALLSFDPHPFSVLNPSGFNGYINTLGDKKEILEKMELDYFIVISFDIRIANLYYKDFFHDFLEFFYRIIVGFDYTFGNNGRGDVSFLVKNHPRVSVVRKVSINCQKISSNYIRNLLKHGKVEEAKKLLTRPYKITGKVIKGRGIGRTMGIRTANINIGIYYPVRQGVYITEIIYNNMKYFGIANYGNNPTFKENKENILEVHIFDLEKDIYDQEISVLFLKKIRNEITFNTKNELIIQVRKDITEAKEYLKREE